MSSYEVGEMTGKQVVEEVLKRPHLYGLCHIPNLERVAEAIAGSMDPEYGIVDPVDRYAAEAVLKLMKSGEENV